MSRGEDDGIDEALQGVTYVAMTTAARLGEEGARAIEARARQRQAAREQEAAEYAARWQAERSAAVSSLRPVHRQEWWDARPDPDQIARLYQTATAWSEHDQDAARAQQLIAEEVDRRYGVRMGSLDRVGDRGRRQERTEVAGVINAADATDRAAHEASRTQEPAESGYDTRQRRAAMTEALCRVIDDPDVVEARMRADIAQGRPASDVVGRATGRAPEARRARRVPGPARTIQDPGRSR